MDILTEQEKAYDFIENTIVKNKKISHAYLVETNGYKMSDRFIKDMIKKILLVNHDDSEYIKKVNLQVDNDSYVDVKVINPDGYWIKKEQLLSIEKEFSKKSILDNKLIYVINNAEKLNDSSANTILKFLEEPTDDIIAILVANNRYKVIDTILSRCQVISLVTTREDIELDNIMIDFINDIKHPRKLMINFTNYNENLFIDKDKSIDTIKKLEMLFYNYLNDEIDNINGNIFQKEKVIKILTIFNEEREKLSYNINLKLWLHGFIVKLIEVE